MYIFLFVFIFIYIFFFFWGGTKNLLEDTAAASPAPQIAPLVENEKAFSMRAFSMRRLRSPPRIIHTVYAYVYNPKADPCISHAAIFSIRINSAIFAHRFNICSPRDWRLSDSKCWNGGHEWVNLGSIEPQGFGSKRFWAIKVKKIKFTTHILFFHLRRVGWMHVWNLWGSGPPTRLTH